MCTVITINQKPRPRTAKVDIVVYKKGNRYHYDSSEFRSEYLNFLYKPDELRKTEFEFTNETCVNDSVEDNYRDTIPERKRVYISKGFHSYATYERAKKGFNSCAFAEFIIPKGAKYYLNGCGNIVSNQIIFKKFIG